MLSRRDSPEPRGSCSPRIATGIRVQRRCSRCRPAFAHRSIDGSRPRARLSSARSELSSRLAAFVIGCLAWGIPLVIASGGVSAYLAALAYAGGRGFLVGGHALVESDTHGISRIGLYQALVLPWASIPLALAVGVAAAIGLLGDAAPRVARACSCSSVAFVPYFVFHLLFQQLDTVRYALAARRAGRVARRAKLRARRTVLHRLLPSRSSPPRSSWPCREESPTAANRIRRSAPLPTRCSAAACSRRRPSTATTPCAGRCRLPIPGRSTSSSRRRSTSGSARWTTGARAGRAPVWFLADQRRTDLALIDPHSRDDVVRYRWAVEQRAELSGTRPLGVDWYRLGVPGWFAGQGWSLTPETGGLDAGDIATGPDHRPIEAWVRRRPGPFHLVVGARHLGNAGDADAEVDAHDRRPADRPLAGDGCRSQRAAIH